MSPAGMSGMETGAGSARKDGMEAKLSSVQASRPAGRRENAPAVRRRAADTVIFSDLDGTLLDGSQRISRENAEAIARFREAGGLFVIATGRPWQSARVYARSLGLEQPLIVCNGAQLYDPAGDTPLRTERLALPPELCEWLYERQQQDDDLGLLLYTGEEMLTPCRNEAVVRHDRKDGLESTAAGPGRWREAAGAAVKLLAVTRTPEAALRLDGELRRRLPGCVPVFSEANYVELLPAGCSKGAALQRLVPLMGWQNKHLIAVGDQMNDAELLQAAGIGIAAGNAAPALLALADAVTVPHGQHALARVIGDWIDLR